MKAGTAILYIVILFSIGYLTLSFVELSFDPFNWAMMQDKDLRIQAAIFMVLILILGVLFAGMKHTIDKNHKS